MIEYRFDKTELEGFATALLEAAGARPDDAVCVAAHLADANLKGHDSHGVGLLPAYVRHARKGLVTLDAEDRVIQETAVILQIDAGGGWGAPSGFRLTKRACAMAREQGLAAATIGNCHHLGRIGAYAERAAAEGLASLHFVNVTDHGPLVAPYRGSDARFGTNPVCIGYPAAGKRPAFLLDIATSQIALGKVRVAANRGTRVPTGSLIDEKGMPTTDPTGMAGFEFKGALTPMGGHKGYGLAFAAEILAGVLSGSGTIQPGNPRRGGLQNRMFSVYINPEKFGDPDWMETEVQAMADYALASPLMDWDSPVLYPGDPERAMAGKRTREGIPLDEKTCSLLNEAAEKLGLETRLENA
ncbi:malate/lactate/ureidoglycolate dehydrogenase [Maricaulis parjimensis]|uniref:malate/lactate/ureidoglycolate dehydrogenase n=1 Tax=Maricaulis parjimensis TaxID=144023 RepID=UPI00193A4243|nr:malate/lactate/ureidoglycolate dehydrogenase [Maricaulis parjimensis]